MPKAHATFLLDTIICLYLNTIHASWRQKQLVHCTLLWHGALTYRMLASLIIYVPMHWVLQRAAAVRPVHVRRASSAVGAAPPLAGNSA